MDFSTTVQHDFVGFFICNVEKPIVWCISAKEIYYNTKNNHKFQASVAERYTSLSKSSGIFRQNPLTLFRIGFFGAAHR